MNTPIRPTEHTPGIRPPWQEIEVPEADRQEQDPSLSPDGALEDPEVSAGGSTERATSRPVRLPLDVASEFDAAEQAIELPFDEDEWA